MPTDIPEQIHTELETRLEAITTGNGYSFSVSGVDRVSRDAREWSPKNLGIGITQPAESRNEQLDHEGNPPANAYDLLFNLHLFVRQSNDSGTSDQTTENAFVASVKKAVANASDWHTFGGLAFNADWGTRQAFIPDEGKHAGATLPLVVQYRISETDPFTSRA